jgi:shikimate dehydrogenase
VATPRAFIIGHPVAQSRSPMLHGYWLKQLGIEGSYELADVAPEALEDFFASYRDTGWVGGNVTVPHKLAVIPFLDKVDDSAQAMGAVNTLWWDGDRLVGGNTDWIGFLGNFDELVPGWDSAGKQAVLIGAGGAARAAAYGLKSRGFAVSICNRTVAKAEEIAAHFGSMRGHGLDALPALMKDADILVNTTSLGMLGKPPLEIDLATLKPGAVVYDVIYVPLETALLKQAKAKGHRTLDGLGMLLHQAVEGFRHWFGATPKVTEELRQRLIDDIRAKTPGA